MTRSKIRTLRKIILSVTIFLPAYPKPCSQKLLEKGENLPCILNKKYGKENYIIEDFYNFLIENNNEK